MLGFSYHCHWTRMLSKVKISTQRPMTSASSALTSEMSEKPAETGSSRTHLVARGLWGKSIRTLGKQHIYKDFSRVGDRPKIRL